MNELKSSRIIKNLTQQEAAKRIGISLRSYIMYENDTKKEGTPKYRFLLQEIEKMNSIDETHGILSIEEIKTTCMNVLSGYHVDFCYLFGSYAKGNAVETSDVDLLVSTDETGLKYYEMLERLRESLHKKIDFLDMQQLVNNQGLLKEIMKSGIKVYG